PEEHGVPSYEELIYIARADRMDDAMLPRFLDAIEAATVWQAENPKEAEALFFEAHPDIDNALNRQAFLDTLPTFPMDPRPLNTEGYERFAAFMTEAGLVSDLPPLSDYAVEID
ncbi:MAG: ABC transporter substrate-binding protein, partial [Pseudomonadota bacterium]